MPTDEWNWGPTAVGSASTALAVIVALATSIYATFAARRERRREHRDTTFEILHAVEEALSLVRLASASAAGEAHSLEAEKIGVMADHQVTALEILIRRPGLSDGAISAGAGAASILRRLAAVPSMSELADRARERHGEFAVFVSNKPRLRAELEAISLPQVDIEIRAVKVLDDWMRKRTFQERARHRWKRWSPANALPKISAQRDMMLRLRAEAASAEQLSPAR